MLDKTTRCVLSFMRETNPNMKDGSFTTDYISKNNNLSTYDCDKCIEYMGSKGLIKRTTIEVGFANPVTWGIELTHKSLHYSEFTWINVKRFLLDNLLALLALIVAIIALIK